MEAQIGGKLAHFGQRLMNGTAKKLADGFFTNFAKALSGLRTDVPMDVVTNALSSRAYRRWA